MALVISTSGQVSEQNVGHAAVSGNESPFAFAMLINRLKKRPQMLQ